MKSSQAESKESTYSPFCEIKNQFKFSARTNLYEIKLNVRFMILFQLVGGL